MNEAKLQRVITLRDLWSLFVQRCLIIILVGIVAGGVTYIRQKTTYVPLYKSTATMYITRDGEYPNDSSAEAYNYFTLALKVVNDCTYFLESRPVVDQTIKDLNLSLSYETLTNRITTENPLNTRVLEVSVVGETPEQAKQIVDRLCELGQEEIGKVMGISHLKLYEYGNISRSPDNPLNMTTALLVGLGGMAITYALFLLMFLLDDRIRTDEDLERLLGLSVLGNIPDWHHAKKGYYAYYGRSRYSAYTSKKSKKK